MVDMLSSTQPFDELAGDAQMFTSAFRSKPEQRGSGWETLAAAGKPYPPGVFDDACTASATDITLRQVALSTPSRLKKPVNPSCSIAVQCEAHVMRAGGCYKVAVDLCVDMQDASRIDKVRSVTKYPEVDRANPASLNPCQIEKERQKEQE